MGDRSKRIPGVTVNRVVPEKSQYSIDWPTIERKVGEKFDAKTRQQIEQAFTARVAFREYHAAAHPVAELRGHIETVSEQICKSVAAIRELFLAPLSRSALAMHALRRAIERQYVAEGACYADLAEAARAADETLSHLDDIVSGDAKKATGAAEAAMKQLEAALAIAHRIDGPLLHRAEKKDHSPDTWVSFVARLEHALAGAGFKVTGGEKGELVGLIEALGEGRPSRETTAKAVSRARRKYRHKDKTPATAKDLSVDNN